MSRKKWRFKMGFIFEWLIKWSDPTVIASVFVSVVAIWYSLETQRLRRTAVEQLTLSRQSITAQFLPYVLAGLHDITTVDLEKKKKLRTS